MISCSRDCRHTVDLDEHFDADEQDQGEDRIDPDLPLLGLVPDGWLPDPESNHGLICPDCLTDEERREASREHQHTVRVLLGEFD